MPSPIHQIMAAIGAPPDPPPLDVLALSATGAWSTFRKLSSSYSGALYASSGSPTRVTTFYDQSGNSRNLTTFGGRPAPLLATAAGYDSLLFGSGDPSPGELLGGAAMSNFISASAGYMIASVQINTFASAPVIFGDQSLYAFVQNATGPSKVIFNNYPQSVSSSTLTASTPYVIEWWHTGGVLYGRVNKGTPVSVTSGDTGSLTDTLIYGGRFLSSTTDGYFWEFATFNSVPSSTDRDYIAGRFMSAIGAT